jgi:hypothetical protein
MHTSGNVAMIRPPMSHIVWHQPLIARLYWSIKVKFVPQESSLTAYMAQQGHQRALCVIAWQNAPLVGVLSTDTSTLCLLLSRDLYQRILGQHARPIT